METFLSSRSLGEESLQMWDLNKRLEAYLARVKFLEEENELLKEEIQGLKEGLVANSWRAKYEDEVAALRATLDQAHQEKSMAELARDSLYEEVQQVTSRCQRERAAQEEAKIFLSVSKKEMEEEKRAHIWLREKATQLEKEMEALVETHQEELLGLDEEMASFSQAFDSPRAVPARFQPVEVEDYAKRLSNIWKGAVETYKTEVSQLEASLCEAKENLWKATERNRQNQLQLQHLEKELVGLKVRKKSLQDGLSQQWAQQQGDAEKLQMAMEALEEEKRSLRSQISQLLEDRQQLMHLKMSLSLEVATYRTLLEAESSRLQMPATDFQLAGGLRDVTTEATHSKLQGLLMDRGRPGSWDVRPSLAVLPQGPPKLRGFQSQAEPLSASLGALAPKRAREPPKTSMALLHPQSTKSLEGPLPPKEASAFRLDSSQPSQAVETPQSVVQSALRAPPPLPFTSLVLEEVSGRPAESLEQSEEAAAAQRAARAPGGAEVFGEKEMEEEEELSPETPGQGELLNGPFPSQMVTEAFETAIQELNRKEAHLEPSLLRAVQSQAGLPFDQALQEGKRDGLSLSAEVLEVAQEDRPGEGPPTDLLQDLQACEDFAEVNGGPEAWAELQGTAEAWQAPDAEAPLPLGAEFLGVEGEEVAHSVTGEKETSEESLEWKEGSAAEELANDLGEAPERPESAPEAAAPESSSQRAWELGRAQPEVLGGASEAKMDEVYAEVEMVSPEDLLPEEKREPWVPPRESNQRGLQTELLQQEGSSAREDQPPTSPVAPSAGAEPLFPEGEQEASASQEGLLVPEAGPALPEQETGLASEALSVGDARPKSRSSAMDEGSRLAGELEATESGEVGAEKAREDVFRAESLLRGETGDEGTREREGCSEFEAPKGTLDLGVPLPGEEVANLQVQDTLPEEQRRKVPEEQKAGGREGGLPEALLRAEGRKVEERGSTLAESEEVAGGLEMEEASGTAMTGDVLQKRGNASEDEELGRDQAGERPAAAEVPWGEQATCPEEDRGPGSPSEAEGPQHLLAPLGSGPSTERDGAAEGRGLLGETRPGGAALPGYSGEVLAPSETPSLPFSEREVSLWSEEEDATPPASEEDGASALPAKERGPGKGAPQEEWGCSSEPLPAGDGPSSEETTVAQTSPSRGDREEGQSAMEAEVARGGEPEEPEAAAGREAEEEPWQGGKEEGGPMVPKEEADGLEPSYAQQEEEEEKEEEEEEEEFSQQGPADATPTKLSPLTSVTDLGEIVLEGAAEPDLLVSCEDECFHASDPEDRSQPETVVVVEGPPGAGWPPTFPEDPVGLSLESRRDSDILEIVEQALELNQELMKAAGDELEALGTDAQRSAEETPLPAPLDQLSTEALQDSSPVAHPWVGSHADGLQEEPSLDELASELLNGIGEGEADASGGGFVKEGTSFAPQLCPEAFDVFPTAEPISHSPPPFPANEERWRRGDVLEEDSLGQEGPETLVEDPPVKGGKDPKLEARPFQFGEEICRQALGLWPEGDVDLHSVEDD